VDLDWQVRPERRDRPSQIVVVDVAEAETSSKRPSEPKHKGARDATVDPHRIYRLEDFSLDEGVPDVFYGIPRKQTASLSRITHLWRRIRLTSPRLDRDGELGLRGRTCTGSCTDLSAPAGTSAYMSGR
jgi:hypothetical protein